MQGGREFKKIGSPRSNMGAVKMSDGKTNLVARKGTNTCVHARLLNSRKAAHDPSFYPPPLPGRRRLGGPCWFGARVCCKPQRGCKAVHVSQLVRQKRMTLEFGWMLNRDGLR